MKRSSTPTFIQEFELAQVAGSGSFHDLEVMSDFYRRLYNAALGHFLRRVRTMKGSQEWGIVRSMAREDEKDRKRRNAHFKAVRESYHLDVCAVEVYLKDIVKGSADFKLWTNSAIVQKIAIRVHGALEKLILGKAKRVRFKKKSELISFEGKSNTTGVRLMKDGDDVTCLIGRKNFAVIFDPINPYHMHALSSPIKFSRIVIRTIRGARRFFIQGLFEGEPYNDLEKKKRHEARILEREGKDYFEKKAALPAGVRDRVSHDIGPGTIAISTPLTSFERPLCGTVDRRQKETGRIQRSMDKKRRAANPQNYNPNGTIKKGPKKWVKTNNYKKQQTRRQEIERKKAAARKSSHGFLSNQILAYGSDVRTEKVSFKAWQMSRYGRSISHHAPSSLQGKLTRKAENARGTVSLLSTYQTALSQHCVCAHRKKKSLSERTHHCDICGFNAPRDTLSAYLALFTDEITISTEGGDRKYWVTDFVLAQKYLSGHRTLSTGVTSARSPNTTVNSEYLIQNGGTTPSETVTQKTLGLPQEPARRKPRGKREKAEIQESPPKSETTKSV